MERLLKAQEKECMRMAILKHEETFKEQVYELHRLYRIQKMLMKNVRNSHHQQQGYVNYITNEERKPQRKLDLERPAEEYIVDDDNGGGVLMVEDESDIELTLGPTSFRRRNKDQTPLTSDAAPSFSSSSTDSNYIHRQSINTYKQTGRRDELTGNKWGIIQVPNMNPSLQSGKNAFDVDAQLKHERLEQSPWLFRVLSLNMT